MLGSRATAQEPSMKGKRHKTEEIIRILRMADGGKAVEEVCREVNICEQTFYRWMPRNAICGWWLARSDYIVPTKITCPLDCSTISHENLVLCAKILACVS